MKIIIIISTILFITTSCSKQEGNDNDNDRLIKLDAGVSTVITAPLSKAAITTESFEATVAGWETSSTPNYTQAATWTSTPTRITIGSTDALELKNNPEYNLETSIKTYVTGWYHAGIPSNDMVSITSTSGDIDVMYAGAISGSLDNKIKQTLTFNHLLTQIKFVIIGKGWETTNKLQSITIDQAQLPISLNIGTGVVTYATIAPLVIPDLSGQTVTTTATPAGVPVMIAPINGNALPLTIVSDSGTTKITATTADTNYQAGKAYTVTLNFNSSGIGVTATVTPWLEGSASGTIVEN